MKSSGAEDAEDAEDTVHSPMLGSPKLAEAKSSTQLVNPPVPKKEQERQERPELLGFCVGISVKVACQI
jgi:hypothetical protein